MRETRNGEMRGLNGDFGGPAVFVVMQLCLTTPFSLGPRAWTSRFLPNFTFFLRK